MVEMTDTLFCHPREGGDLPSIQPDLRLIASMRFAAFPVVKLQQSSEVYCHIESDTNLHGNDKPRIQTSYLLPLVEGARGSCILKKFANHTYCARILTTSQEASYKPGWK